MLLKKDNSLLLLIDVQAKLTPLVLHSQALIDNCQWMLKLAHTMQVPIVVAEQYPQGLGYILEEFHPFFVPTESIEKLTFSCMDDPHYAERIVSHEKKQMVLIGIEAHVCVLQTALDLLKAGYEVFVVVDAVSSRKEIDLKFALKRMKQAGAQLVTPEMVFFEWVSVAGTPEFKALSKEFLQ